MILIDLLKAFARQIEGFVRHDLKCDEDIAYDAVIDVLYAYVATPGRYDPDRKVRLVTYLTKAAKYRVRDRLKSGVSRALREENFASVVELEQPAPKDILENFVEASRAVDRLEKRLSETDLAALRLIVSGEGSTEVLARALGLDPSSQEEMRREVKRHRDRLMKTLERLGKEDPDDPA
ncbi:RNA polymerase sigma factor [Cystobacter fuscus]|uniref:RNA polymerase sigma factor n=1 Tax=Cystobacter fuscus TaxID=43 RepID=UPI0012FE16DF|nr:sigma-70 family RNA polymerase sigma factor [Cystobacter fuscus]